MESEKVNALVQEKRVNKTSVGDDAHQMSMFYINGLNEARLCQKGAGEF